MPGQINWFSKNIKSTQKNCQIHPGKKQGPSAETVGSTFCLPCTPGEFGEIDDDIHICSKCPTNTYSDVPEQKTSCKKCPSGRKSLMGAASCSFCSAGQHVNGDECTTCRVGQFQPGMEESSCQNCPNGRTSEKGSAVCASCTTGFMQVGNDINSYTCLECERGKIAQAGDMQCTSCVVGLFQSEKGKGICQPCEAGTWSDTIGSSSSSNCKKCNKGTYSTATGSSSLTSCNACPPGKNSQTIGASNSATCKACKQGTSSNAGAIACSPCSVGKHQNQPGSATCISCVPGTNQPDVGQTDCKECLTGRASKTSANANTECEACSEGRYQLDAGQTMCLSCQPGQHQDLLGASTCKLCLKNYFANVPSSSICNACSKGRYTAKIGQASCSNCGAGKFGVDVSRGSCSKCPEGWKRAEEDIDLTLCIRCQLGEDSLEGSTSCSACGIGQYGSVAGVCTACPKGQYQSDKKQTTCLRCKDGRLPNEQATGCVVPTYRVKEDCDFVNQYLNNSGTDKNDWECQPCPLGGYCEGNIDWSGVRPKYGYWRTHEAAMGNQTPACLWKGSTQNQQIPECAFEQCKS